MKLNTFMRDMKLYFIVSMFVLGFAIVALFPVRAGAAYAEVTSANTLNVGSRGDAVTALQTFLASNPDIYPAGIVSGYYGPLTKEAVKQFQLHYDLDVDGIAGPMTKTKMNALIRANMGLDVYAPVLSNVVVTNTGTTTHVSFSSNEPVKASVFYDTAGILLRNHSLVFGAPNATAGGVVQVDATFGMNKSLALPNLAPNTNYNYVVMAVDASGNITLTWPKVFQSGQ